MRPFGNDITNIANNGNGNSNNNNNNNNNNSNNNGTNNNSNANEVNNNNGSDNDNYEEDPRIPSHIARIGGILTFSPKAGKGIIRVVERCEDAKENSKLESVKKLFRMAHSVVKVIERCENAQENAELDLSKCELMQIPDAVYHLMRNTELKTCDLSGNVIKKISPKLAIKFSLITELNLSHNQMTKLPDELADMANLAHLNISHNSFIALPPVVFKMPKLQHLDASHNAIIEIHTDDMIASDSLELVDLRHNPLGRVSHRKLQNANTPFRIEISEYNDDEDW